MRYRLGVLGLLVLLAGCTGGGGDPEGANRTDGPADTTDQPPSKVAALVPEPLDTSNPLAGDFRPQFWVQDDTTALAVGSVGETPGLSALTSSDGQTWQLTALDPALFGERPEVFAAAGGPGGFVAIGIDSQTGVDPAFWQSADGKSWSRVTLPAESLRGTIFREIVATPTGYVAIGHNSTSSDGGSVTNIVVLTSPDGAQWTLSPPVADLTFVGFARPEPSLVVAGDSVLALMRWRSDEAAQDAQRRAAAGGLAPGPVATRAAEVWSSVDNGVTWSKIGAAADVFPGVEPHVASVVDHDGRYVAAGSVDEPAGRDAAIWTSSDQRAWERADGGESLFGGDGDQTIRTLVVVDETLVAIGHTNAYTGDDFLVYSAAEVWSSSDGTTWARAAVPADAAGADHGNSVSEVVTVGEQPLVIGRQFSIAPLDARRAARANRQPAPATTSKVVSYRIGEADPVKRPDQAGPDVAAPVIIGGASEQWLEDVVATDSGFLAVGWDQKGGDEAAAMWSSSDGTKWAPVALDPAAADGPGDQFFTAITRSERGYTAVGADAAGDLYRPMVWTSPDGQAWQRLPLDPGLVSESIRPEDVAVNPAGATVVVGKTLSGETPRLVVLHAADGATFTRADTSALTADPAGVQHMDAVAVTSSGFAAVGSDGAVADGFVTVHAAAWTSSDGASWQGGRLPEPAGVLGGNANGITVVGSELYVLGDVGGEGDDRGAPVIWTSGDGGTTWTLADQQPPDDPGVQEVGALVVLDDGAAVLGGVHAPLDGGDAGVWVRTGDDEAWERVVAPEEAVFGGDAPQVIYAAAARGRTVVLVGYTGKESNEESVDAAVWVIDL